ncbi:flagellar filament capping protein FliD [Xanthomonas translucens]|uniref:flagellar filament capping protein FliD n=1 Tax=Xanthomonas campestris pv. translucens TaxID=343 RepID=UPI00057028F0|nr:flagellar filament capping protein FliD [Xanthomonas translucens]MBC3971887.1 flagellar filament capping protein FliD [Xanthomonas translucens pv. undulosa]MCT8280990.1 flagellar filament capping protein FliD [Xanthomonas translucens pv. undulosa]MCT8315698.1 flagellar filament capping protein FliD [Xanthomonas translucens pv. undulosa]QSQ57800.1 flagellar filament capping protein FliD [Xanthomonas translucens pv. undulosa]UKE41391.1 flagellar filament capping protein FliD [Xanthomonas tran
MATSSLSTVGSGMDIAAVVKALVAAQRAPQENRINSDGTASSAQLSALSTIKGALSNLQTAMDAIAKSADKSAVKATVADGAGYTASVTESATAGNYSVEVVKLAERQKLTSSAYADNAVVGDGSLTIGYGGKTLNVTVAENSKLRDVAAAINKAAGGSGVTASVVSADDGDHLVLNAVDSGSKGALTITSAGGNGGLAALTYSSGSSGGLTQTVAGADAVVRVDGFERTSSSNAIADLVPGVTLNLTKAAEGTKYSLSIANDSSSLKANLTALVSAYNTVNTVLKSSSAYDATNKKASALTGDSMVRGLTQTLRKQVSDNTSDLKALGVTIDKNGVMSFNSAKLDSAVASDPASVKAMFGTDGSFTTGMNTLLDSNLDTSNGTITQRTTALNKHISDLTDQLSNLDQRMATLTTNYTAKFTAMDAMIAQMKSVSDTLTQQFS